MKIEKVHARQIFDSRGYPTVEAEIRLEDGTVGVGSAPSGASTGVHEAHERRDGEEPYCGKGVTKAVCAVNTEVQERLKGMRADDQQQVDEALIGLDGTPQKTRIGANATLAVSLATADAAAKSAGMPLYRWLGGVQGRELPLPMMNVLNGGAHAGNNIDIQEFMIVPVGAESFAMAMRMGMECYHALKAILRERGLSVAVGDEGGFAPDLEDERQAMELLVQAIERAGWRPGEDVMLSLDMAASEWKAEDGYMLPKRRKHVVREDLVEYCASLARDYPLLSVEDPLHEEDFEGFRQITERLGGEVMIVGDDLFTTNAERLLRGSEEGAANAILVKPNQIGTLSETLETIRLAGRLGYSAILSHRSGETESTAIADIAVAVNAPLIKSGAPARSERLAKYNRLLRIEEELCFGRGGAGGR